MCIRDSPEYQSAGVLHQEDEGQDDARVVGGEESEATEGVGDLS